MSERITIDLEKMRSVGWTSTADAIKECAKRTDSLVPDSPAPPTDDRLDVIFEFATLMGWLPVRDMIADGTVTIFCNGGRFRAEHIGGGKLGEAAASYCWRRGWAIGKRGEVDLQKMPGWSADEHRIWLVRGNPPTAFFNEHLVRAVVKSARALKEQTP